MTSPPTCPRCHQTLALTGGCGCDVDGIPPRRDDATSTAARRADEAAAARDLHARQPGPPLVRLDLVGRQQLELHLRAVEACALHLEGGTLCDRCADALAEMLKAVPVLVLDLNTQRAGIRGIDYRRLGGGKGATTTRHTGPDPDDPDGTEDDGRLYGAAAVPWPISPAAIAARDRLRHALRPMVFDCLHHRVRDTSPNPSVIPHRGDLPALAAWLLWRVDGMQAHPAFVDVATALADAVRYALRVVDSRAGGIDLGPCVELLEGRSPCSGRMQAAEGAEFAICSRCETSARSGPLREKTIDRARSTSATAAQIAGMASLLDLVADRDTVRRRINLWHHRGLVAAVVPGEDPPRFVFGDVVDRLRAYEARHRHSYDVWRPVPNTTVDEETGRQPHQRRCLDCPHVDTTTRKPERKPTRTAPPTERGA